jgi:hypothetical protein
VDCHETSKDNPALSQRAASGMRAEEAFITQREQSPAVTQATALDPVASVSSLTAASLVTTALVTSTAITDLMPQLQTIPTESWSNISGSKHEEHQHLLSLSLTTVLDKLSWASSLLRQEESDLVRAAELAILVKELAGAARVLSPSL